MKDLQLQAVQFHQCIKSGISTTIGLVEPFGFSLKDANGDSKQETTTSFFS